LSFKIIHICFIFCYIFYTLSFSFRFSVALSSAYTQRGGGFTQAAAHCRLCGAQNLQGRTAFRAGYTAACVKPLVVGSVAFCQNYDLSDTID
jgi:hypothetical protein